MKRIARIVMACLACALALGTAGCSGGGRTAVIGFSNDNNNLGEGDVTDELAAALAKAEGTPQVTDAMIAEIFSTILEAARKGDADAALIVLKVAEGQRESDEG